MIANVLAFIATVAVLTILTIGAGGRLSSWLMFGVGILFFGIANAINVSLRHKPHSASAMTPILEPVTLAGASPNRTQHLTSIQAPCVTEEAHKSSALDVGHIVDDLFAITRDEIGHIRINWKRFNNVFRLRSYGSVVDPITEIIWYLVLSPRFGVLFNENADQVWTISPSGISIARRRETVPLLKIHSVDGRTEKVYAVDCGTTVPCILAWISESLDDFQSRKLTWWTLLLHELETGHSPRPFLRWDLPYPDAKQGLLMLRADRAALKEFLTTVNLEHIVTKLEGFGLDRDPVFACAIQNQIRANARTSVVLVCSSGVLAVFIVWVAWHSWITWYGESVPRWCAGVVSSIVIIVAGYVVMRIQRGYKKKIEQLKIRGN